MMPHTQSISHDAIDSSTLSVDNSAKSVVKFSESLIAVDVSDSTGLRKTGFSDQIYTEASGRKMASKIPRSPTTIRRKSVENLSTTETGLPLIRGIPQYKSLRKVKEVTKDNTWSGRMAKKRPNLSNETYISQSKPNSPSPSRRSPAIRSGSTMQYDQNGRRIKPISVSANTSPIKTKVTSPLAQQFLEVAGQAKNDEQFLEKMKILLAQYTKNEPNYDDEDFTTAWVKSNGTVEHSKTKNSKPTAKASSISGKSEQENAKEIPTRTSSRLSRIPAPVRANTGLY